MKFLDLDGLKHFWDSIKDKLSPILTKSVIGWNGDEIPEGYEEVNIPDNSVVTGSIIEYEGDTIPEGYKEVEPKGIATFVTPSGAHLDYTISTAYTFVPIKLGIQTINIGNTFTLNSDGSFTVNKDCVVKMSCNIMINNILSPIMSIRRKADETSVGETYFNRNNAAYWNSLVITPTVLSVKAGEVFYIGVAAESTGTLRVASTGFSWITLEEV